MARALVDPGVCGFAVAVVAERGPGRTVRVTLETECEMVRKMAGELAVLDVRSALGRHADNPVLRAAAAHLRHVACPVPSAILKAVEVEVGACAPKDVHVRLEKGPARG
jgi:hypothetical protein